jgi:hypothetical protein
MMGIYTAATTNRQVKSRRSPKLTLWEIIRTPTGHVEGAVHEFRAPREELGMNTRNSITL